MTYLALNTVVVQGISSLVFKDYISVQISILRLVISSIPAGIFVMIHTMVCNGIQFL